MKKYFHRNKFLILFLTVILGLVLSVIFLKQSNINSKDRFINDLNTDTSNSSININSLIRKNNSKYDIKPIDIPNFSPVDKTNLKDSEEGILVVNNGESKFYPVYILKAHEVVNDRIGNKYILVTYCPLCRTGGVYDRTVNSEILDFGVSGLLYDSNLVLFDRKTDSLWPQALGRAVVGSYTGTELNQVDFIQANYDEVKKSFPEVRVLDEVDNFDYSLFKKSDDDKIVFNNEDHAASELLYVIEYKGKFLGVPVNNLNKNAEYDFKFNDEIFNLSYSGDEVVIKTKDKSFTGFYEPLVSFLFRFGKNSIIIDSFN